MDRFDILHTTQLYQCSDPAYLAEQTRLRELLYEYNHSRPAEQDKRDALLSEMFAEIGENSFIEAPFYAGWSGKFVHFGKNVYANFGLTLVDDTHIYVGDYVMFGPNVTVTTAGHPIHPPLREQCYQYNAPVRIGRNCWIGAGAIILPGVTIGENSVIGAGSIVNKDIPANVVAVGNPCRVLRPIGQKDIETYFRGKPVPAELID